MTNPFFYHLLRNKSFAGMLPVPSKCRFEPERPVAADRSPSGWMPRSQAMEVVLAMVHLHIKSNIGRTHGVVFLASMVGKRFRFRS